VKLACELPDIVGRSLSTWTCAELARTLKESGVVNDISPQSVQRILCSYKLKPWRVHYWLTPKAPRDADFRERVENLCDLYTRALDRNEVVLCADEKTSIQPRPRAAPTRPAQINLRPVNVEHEYERKGALNLLAAFDTRTGKVFGILRRRKRQVEFIELLEHLDRRIPSWKTRVHIVCDNVSTHHGKKVRAWLEKHPRFRLHFPPVHCSWMNQIEQWFSILQRKRLKLSNFADLDQLAERITAFIAEWNEVAAPFEWTAKSFQKVLEKVDVAIRRAA
jgi:transposase